MFHWQIKFVKILKNGLTECHKYWPETEKYGYYSWLGSSVVSAAISIYQREISKVTTQDRQIFLMIFESTMSKI